MFYKCYGKRLIDIVLSLIGIIVLSPVFLVIILGIRFTSKGPAILKQERSGKNKVPFIMYKFRTMRIDTPQIPTYELEDIEKYITKIGHFLRKTSLDELPQLFNIFKGNMSIVGYRPILCNENVLMSERDKYGVNSYKPGLTGWAQVNGRNDISLEERAYFDGEYVREISLKLDIKIIFKTIADVLVSRGVEVGEELATSAENTEEENNVENIEVEEKKACNL